MLDVFIRNAWAQAAPTQESGGGFIIMMIVFIALMYFVILRPQMKQAKEHKALLEGLVKGDEIMLSSGLVGKIKDMGDNFILLEVAQNIDIKVQKKSVSTVLPKGSLKSL